MSPIKIAVIPAAGFGSRMLPASKATPKELLTVVDRPVIQYIVEEALEAGIEHVVFVVSRGKEAIEAYFDHNVELENQLEAGGKTALLAEVTSPILNQGRASFVRQGKALGLGHAIWCARDIVGDQPFAVLLPDMICAEKPGATKALVDLHAQTGGCAISVTAVPEDETHKYGIITPGTGPNIGPAISIGGLVEKPPQGQAPSNLIITGRYVFTPDIFAHLAKAERGTGGEIQLTDSMIKLIGSGPFHGVPTQGPVYDCGDKIGWLTANIGMARLRDDVWPELSGVMRGFLD